VKEPELVDKVGLDAVAFLRFLRLLRWLFSSIAFLTCAVLIPINVTQSLRNVPDSTQRDQLSILTIRNVTGKWLFVHVGVTYLITILIIVFVNYHWKEMVRLRQQWFRSPEHMQSFYARTLAVTAVPKKYQSDEGIREIFQSVQVPYPTTSVHIGRKVGRLPELIEYHNTTVRQLEAVLVQYLKDGKIAKNRPMIRIGGFWGCGGVKKDAIDFYTYVFGIWSS
jgi:calcium permeable stress-gated cation channel